MKKFIGCDLGGTNLRVIHGLGTGVLRREITAWLKRRAEVASFRRGEPGEGSSGVTVVSLKP
jgi:DNA mismatch repair protein MutS2